MVVEPAVPVGPPGGQPRVQHQRQPRELPRRHVDDVSGLQLLQRGGRRRSSLRRALLGQLRLAVLEVAPQARVLLEVPEVAGHALLVALQALLVALHLPRDPHDRLVRLELGERGLQQFARTVPPELLHQVDRHVVRRAEAGAQRIRARAREAGQRRRVHAALPQDHRVALDVDAAPSGPAGELGVLAGGDVGVLLAVPLDELLQHHGARGHVDAERQRLGGEDRLDQPPDEQFLDDLLEGREHARVVGGDAPFQSFEPLVVAQDVQVLAGDGGGPLLDDLADQPAVVLVVEPEAGVQALLDGGLAARTAEDEGDGGQQALVVQPVDDLGPAGRPDPAALAPLALAVGLAHHLAPAPVARVVGVLVLLAGEPDQVRVDLAASGAPAAVVGGLLEEVVHPASGHHVLPERHRTVLGDDHLGVAAHGVQPVAELLRVGDGRRQGDQRHRLREVDDHFLPDRAPEAVGEVVHLVHDHIAQAGEGLGTRVQHVPQDLGGHHDHRRLGVDAVVAGQQPDLVRAVPLDQVGELLVGERLDRCGVEAFAALLQGQVHGELADDRLARPGGGRDQHPLAGLQGLACLDLERVQTELVHLAERPESRRHLGRALARSLVSLSW